MTNLNHKIIDYALRKLQWKLSTQGLYMKQVTVTDKKPDDSLEWIVLNEENEDNNTESVNQ